MGHIQIQNEQIRPHDPVFPDGLPGLGLVGKIATDYIINQYGLSYYASIECPGLPQVAVYQNGSRSVLPPVRIYADESSKAEPFRMYQ